MESQASRVTTSTAHGVLMRVSEYLLSLSPKVSRYRALSRARVQSSPPVSRQILAWPRPPGTHSTLHYGQAWGIIWTKRGFLGCFRGIWGLKGCQTKIHDGNAKQPWTCLWNLSFLEFCPEHGPLCIRQPAQAHPQHRGHGGNRQRDIYSMILIIST